MDTIWKYKIPVAPDMEGLTMPKGAKILCLQLQYDEPTLWALVDTEQSEEKRHFAWCGTGFPLANVDKFSYIGTVQLNGGATVFHLFERS